MPCGEVQKGGCALPTPLPLLSCLTLHVSLLPEALGAEAGLADAVCPRTPPFIFLEEEEEESLALVAIETNSLPLCCKVVRRSGHASLSIRMTHPSSTCLQAEPPPGPLSDQVPPLGQEKPQAVT